MVGEKISYFFFLLPHCDWPQKLRRISRNKEMNTMLEKDTAKLLDSTRRVSTRSPLISFSLKPFCVTELRVIWNSVRTLLFFLLLSCA